MNRMPDLRRTQHSSLYPVKSREISFSSKKQMAVEQGLEPLKPGTSIIVCEQ
jgi:hypothetical protein